ncbi:MAG: hypothetical protein K0R00_3213 [Herbinix sp.]|jgi:hypothetical protein|nr:hypothetical protein [Herbinix sp.]
MKTLIVYDNSGKVWNIIGGMYEVPNGLPYLEVEVPADKRIVSIDLSGEVPTVIYEDYPKSQELNRIELLENALNDLLLGGM